MITGFAQVHVNVVNMERAIRFYVDIIGMTLVDRPAPEWTSLKFHGVEFGLLKLVEPTPYIQRSSFGSRAGATVTFWSSNIAADRKRLEDAQINIVSEGQYHWGHCLVFEDTEGNILRLYKRAAV